MADVKIDKHDLNKLAQMFASELARVMPGAQKKRGNHERKRDEKDESKKTDTNASTQKIVIDTDLANKSLKQLTKSLGEYQAEMEDYNRGLRSARHSHKELVEGQSALLKGLVNHSKLTNRAQDKLRDKIMDGIVAQSKMGEQMLKGARSMRDLIDRIDDSADTLNEYDDAMKKAGHSTLKNIKTEAQMRKVLTALKDTVIGADAAIGDISKASETELRKKLEQVSDHVKAHQTMVTSASSTTQSFMGLYIWSDRAKDAMKAVTGQFGAQLGWMGQLGQWGAALGLVVTGIARTYDDWRKLSQTGLANDFLTVSGSSIKLGLTMEEITKVMKDNQNQLAQMSLDGMIANIRRNQDSLIALGESTDGAARGIAAMTENAIATGINARDEQALQKSIDSQVRSFEKLRALTGQTAEEFAKTNAQIIDNADYTKVLAHTNKASRKLLLEGITKERERLALMGLSNEQQAKYLNTIQKLLSGNVDDRLKQRAGLSQLASMGGASQDVIQELDRILLKGTRATGAEQSFLAQNIEKFTSVVDKQIARGGDQALMLENAYDAVTKDIQGLVTNARDANVASETKGVTNEELNKRIEQARLDGDAVTLVKTLNQLESALKNPLVQTAAGVTALVALTSMQLAKNNKFLDFFRKGKAVKPDFVGPMPQGRLAKMRGAIASGVSSMRDIPTKAGILKDSMKFKGQDIYRKYQTDGLNLGGHMKDGFKKVQGSVTKGMSTGFSKVGGSISGAINSMPIMKAYNQAAAPLMPTRVTKGPNAIGADFRGRDGRFITNADGMNQVRGARKAGRKAALKSVGRGAVSVATSPFTAMGKVAKAATSNIAKMGVKAIPFLGAVVMGLEALHDGFKASDNAAEIFKGKIKEDGVTTSMKISAGIAGGLSALTFGLVDTNEMAQTLHEYFKDGGERIIFAIKDSLWSLRDGFVSLVETIPNQLLDGIGYLADKIIMTIFDGFGMLKDIVMGESNAAISEFGKTIMGIGSTIGGGILNAFKFIGDTLIKAIMKAVNYIFEKIDGVTSNIPGVDSLYEGDGVLDKMAQGVKAAAEAQVKWGNRASLFNKEAYEAQSKQMREDEAARKKAYEDKRKAYAANDKTREMERKMRTGEITQEQVELAEKERLTKIRMEAIKNIGQVNSLNASLSKEQLAAQGVTDLSVEKARWKLAGVDPNDKRLVTALEQRMNKGEVTKPVVAKEEGLGVLAPVTPAEPTKKSESVLSTFMEGLEKLFAGWFGAGSPMVAAAKSNTSVNEKISNALNKSAGTEVIASSSHSQISRNGRNYELTADESKQVQAAMAKGEIFTPTRIQEMVDEYVRIGMADGGFTPNSPQLISKDMHIDKGVQNALMATKNQASKGVPVDRDIAGSGVLSIQAQQEIAAAAQQKKAEDNAGATKDDATKRIDELEKKAAGDKPEYIDSVPVINLLEKLVNQGERALVLKEQQVADNSLNNLQRMDVAGGSNQQFFNKKTGFA